MLQFKNTHVIVKVQQERNTAKKNLKKVLTRHRPHDILKIQKSTKPITRTMLKKNFKKVLTLKSAHAIIKIQRNAPHIENRITVQTGKSMNLR